MVVAFHTRQLRGESVHLLHRIRDQPDRDRPAARSAQFKAVA